MYEVSLMAHPPVMWQWTEEMLRETAIFGFVAIDCTQESDRDPSLVRVDAPEGSAGVRARMGRLGKVEAGLVWGGWLAERSA